MKDTQVKYMNSLALQNWHSEHEESTYQSQQMLKLQRKLNSCSTLINLSSGNRVRTRCRCAICPTCSREYSATQSLAFVKNLEVSDKRNCRFMTVVLGLTCDIEQVYCMFDAFRTKLRKDISNRRDRQDTSARLWRHVGLSGCMELDSVMSGDWTNLGTIKKHQYEVLLGYSPPEGASVPVYIVTGHFCVFKGRLSLKTFSDLVEKSAKYVNFEKLYEEQDLPEAVRSTLAYGCKIEYKTELENYTFRLWGFEQIQALSGLISRSRGRLAWKFAVKQRV